MNNKTRDLTITAAYATLIFLGIQFFRIPMPAFTGAPFVHIGNALVLAGALVLGMRRGTAAAVIGLIIFDLLNGYVTSIPQVVIETLVVMAVTYLVYYRLLRGVPTTTNIVITGIMAGLVKIVINFGVYMFKQMFLLNALFQTALVASIGSMGGTFFSAIFTVVLTPILVPIFTRILKRI
ncbi:ECF transporter S component [Atopobacter phocae]|uniref:ECF transporter S component n=1 Tax=Atopobacter phocae TaxID=136492 RepID=UPI000472DD15|nr:ECF transporter S component [Atopobacter phocae]